MILHVSPNGKNTESGLDLEHALGDIQAAYERLIQEKRRGSLGVENRIVVHGGTYAIRRPLRLEENMPVCIGAPAGEAAIVSGGYEIPEWEEVTLNGRGMLRAALPDWVPPVQNLFVDGKFAEPASFPKQGYYRTAPRECDAGKFTVDETNFDSFAVEDGAFDQAWHAPQDIYVHMMHLWISERLCVESYDAEKHIVHTSSSLRYSPKSDNTEFRFCNVREALTEAGEFYYDRQEHAVYYIPREPAGAFKAVVPVCGELLRLSGAAWVKLENLQFAHGGAYDPCFGKNFDMPDSFRNPACGSHFRETLNRKGKPAYSAPQAAVNMPGAINVVNSSQCEISGCRVTAHGWYGLCIAEGCRNIQVRNCELCELGGGGIQAGGGDAEMVEEAPGCRTSHLILADNHIHDCGKVAMDGVGIMMLNASRCLVEHNHIHDLFYSGISCGWVWGYAPNVACENRIAWNHIHDLGKGLLSDMGGIYTLGIQPGTQVHHNLVHDIVSRYYGGWGLYTDEGSSHIVLEHNIAYNCSCDGYHQHYGRENMVRNNIFCNSGICGAAFSRDAFNGYCSPGEPHTHVMNFFRNVIVGNGKPMVRVTAENIQGPEHIYLDDNLFQELSGQEPVFLLGDKRVTFQEWRKKGFDLHSAFGDPCFVNPEEHNFHFAKESPLADLGFEDWEYEKAGCR